MYTRKLVVHAATTPSGHNRLALVAVYEGMGGLLVASIPQEAS